MTNTYSHGGRRPGSGRRPAQKHTVAITVTLYEDQIELLRRIGDGNVSEGIRRLVTQQQERTHDQPAA